MELVDTSSKNKIKNVHLFEISLLLTVQIGEENTQGYGQMTPYKFF